MEEFTTLIEEVRKLTYGRNLNRDFKYIFDENKGTCSTKHAYLKWKANVLGLQKEVKLFLCIYKMNIKNTAKIGKVLSKFQLDYIPEAHCILKINEEFKDCTSLYFDFRKLESDVLYLQEILPEEIIDFKPQFHQSYLHQWIEDEKMPYTFQGIWEIREECIKELESL